eukprot:Opistho-2@48704
MAKAQTNGKRKRPTEAEDAEETVAKPAKKQAALPAKDVAATLSTTEKNKLIETFADMGDDDGADDGADDESDEEAEEDESDDSDFVDGENDESDDAMDTSGGKQPALEVKDDLYRPPTSEEISTLKETADLFKSNLFRMQTTELLAEISVGAKSRDAITVHLNVLKEIIEKMKDLKEVEVTTKSVKGVTVPLVGPGAIKASFKKPAAMTVVGSFAAGFAAKPNVNVDVAVEMPLDYFQPKDHLNYRYFHKRAYYLAVVAAAIKKDGRLGPSVQYADWAGDSRRPIIVIDLSALDGKKKGNAVIRIFPTISTSTFALNKLAPNRNNVRRHKLGGGKTDDGLEAASEQQQPATPRYNNAILMDAYMTEHARLLKECADTIPAFGDAAILLRVWLRRRLFASTADGVTGFVASMLLAHLVGIRKINRHMSSYQIVRLALELIANTDFIAGLSMTKNTTEETPALDVFSSSFDASLVDTSGRVNLLASVSKAAAEELRMEARASVAVLSDVKGDGFDALFMQQIDFNERYDNYVNIPALPPIDTVGSTRFADPIIDWCDWSRLVSAFVVALLRKGLGDRAIAVRPRPITTTANASKYASGSIQSLRDASSPQPAHTATSGAEVGSLSVGLLLHPENSLRLVDFGPSPQDEDASRDFRAFWGAKAELRRFQDGRILESAVWQCDRHERARIPERICLHLLARHIRLPATNVKVVSSHSLVAQVLVKEGSAVDTGVQDSFAVMAAFESLSKALRGADLPLTITAVAPASPALRGTDPFPPSPITQFTDASQLQSSNDGHQKWLDGTVYGPLDGSVKAIRVWISLESSLRWPDSLEAVRRVRTAFQLRLIALLGASKGGHFGPFAATDDYVEVAHKGFVFKISIAHEGEVTLLRARDPSLGDRLHRNAFLRPSLASKLAAFSLRTMAYGETARLAKRWLRSHLLSGHFTDEAVELLVAHCFAHPHPHATPGTALSGFARFLALLSRYEFATRPLVVDVDGELKDASAVEAKFRDTERSRLPALYIVTPESPTESRWTELGPSQPVLNRAVVLARESLRVLKDLLNSATDGDVDFTHIFRTPLEDYDVVFRLHANRIPNYPENVDARLDALAGDSKKSRKGYKNLELSANGAKALPLIDFNPVNKYVYELRKQYAHIAMFFHDIHGGDVVGVVFLPHAKTSHKLKVSAAQDTAPVKGVDGAVTDNIDEIIASMQHIGDGLVASVERKH